MKTAARAALLLLACRGAGAMTARAPAAAVSLAPTSLARRASESLKAALSGAAAAVGLPLPAALKPLLAPAQAAAHAPPAAQAAPQAQPAAQESLDFAASAARPAAEALAAGALSGAAAAVGRPFDGGLLLEAAAAVAEPAPAEAPAVLERRTFGSIDVFQRRRRPGELNAPPRAFADFHEPLAFLLTYGGQDLDAYYQDVIERVDDRASVLMVVPDQASLDGMKEMLRRRAPRRRVLLFNAQARTDPWVRDKIVVARSPGGIKLLMRPGYDGDTESLRKFAQAAGIEVQRLELNHQGGDLLFDGENLFVGQRTVESNPPWEQSQRQRRKEILAGKFMAAFGPDVKVYFVPDPLLYHLDVSMTLLPGRKVVLGDAALGLRGLEEETPERRQALFSAFKERERPQRWRDLTAWTGEILLEQEAIRVDLESARRLARVAPDLEATRRDLRLAGFEVTAVPLALGYQYIDINRTGKIVPLTSYNNVLFLGGTVLMPEAGLALDESARRAYESLGYSVGSLPQAVALSAREGGARCAGVPIPRTPETVWQLQRLAAAAKADPRFYVHGGGALAP